MKDKVVGIENEGKVSDTGEVEVRVDSRRCGDLRHEDWLQIVEISKKTQAEVRKASEEARLLRLRSLAEQRLQLPLGGDLDVLVEKTRGSGKKVEGDASQNCESR